jgi:uncharacterized protein (TIGR02996 family)
MTDAFLQTLQAKPDDDTTRLVYHDWLQEQDGAASQARAEFIRVDLELARKNGRRRAIQKLRDRRRELAVLIEPVWLAVIGKAPIEKCEFSFECPKKWENLRPVEGATTTRHCESCERDVYYCDTIEAAQDHAWGGHCVAVDARLVRSKGDLDLPDHLSIVVGVLA